MLIAGENAYEVSEERSAPMIALRALGLLASPWFIGIYSALLTVRGGLEIIAKGVRTDGYGMKKFHGR